MKRFMIVITLFVVTLGMLSIPTSLAAQERETDPESVIRAILGALDAGDAEKALSYADEDAVIVVLPPGLVGGKSTVVGKEALRDWWGMIAQDNSEHRLWDFNVVGNKATWKATIWGDAFRNLGMTAPLEVDCVGIVEDGLLKSYTWKATDESMARMEGAIAQQAVKAAAARYMEELWNQGNLAVADEILAANFVSHNFPAGDREALKGAVTGFRAENPNAYFVYDDPIVTEDRVFIGNTMMVRPQGAAADAKGEPAGGPMVLVLGVKDGKFTDRWLFVSPPE